MFFKKKIKLELFVKEYFLPLIDEIMESELDLLEGDITKYSNIIISKNALRFELFLLFVYLSGRGLSTINGFNFDTAVNFPVLINDAMQEKFDKIKLNRKWLAEDQENLLNPILNYYKNKATAYHEAEISYHNNQIDKDELSRKIYIIFFSVENSKIKDGLAKIIGEIHKGSFFFLYEKLSDFSKEYRLI